MDGIFGMFFFVSDSAVRRGPFVEIVIEVESEAPYGAGF
jgi:hypothetical protein